MKVILKNFYFFSVFCKSKTGVEKTKNENES